jgi:hypothetical protein
VLAGITVLSRHLLFEKLAASPNLEWSRERKFVTVRVVNVEIAFSPGCILRTLWTESFFVEMSPECVHVSDMKYYPAPINDRNALLQIDNWKLGIWNTQRRKACIRPTIEEFQPKHIPVEVHGSFHTSDFKGDR